MLVMGIAIYRKGLGLTFFYDEWTFVFSMRGRLIGSFSSRMASTSR